jgi:Zn-dependent peptidase ImmA (M78 family)
VIGDSPRLQTALFDGDRLRQARVFNGLRKTELAHRLRHKVTPTAIGQYEQGRIRPGPPTLAALSLALGFPPEFFERGRRIPHAAEGQAHFRRLRSTSKLDRDRLLVRLELLVEIVEQIEAHVRLPDVGIPDDIPTNDDVESDAVAEAAAGELRRQWELGSGPIDNVVRLLESKGAIVVRPQLDTGDVDAFSTWAGGRPIVVLGQDKADPPRSRFDVAHELGHLVLHHDAEPGRQTVEQQAHRFAAAFLLPAECILRELPLRMSWPAYFALKQRWRVSLAALLYRARSLGALSSDAYQRAQIYLSSRGWRESEPIDIGPLEQPTLLSRALDLMRTELQITTDDIARHTRLPVDVLRSLLADVLPEGEPKPVVQVD